MNNLPCYIQIASPLDFSRLVCALERAPRISFLHEHKGQRVLSVQMDLLKDKPVIYYTLLPETFSGHYLSYGFKSGQEESDIVDSTADTTRMYSPIVKVRSLPANLKPGDEITEKYHPIVLDDLASLTKLSYSFEDAYSFPLFLFPRDNKWLVGVFMHFNEKGSSYFCYVILDEDPKKPFLKFSSTKNAPPCFTSNPDEHGYSYIKFVKLAETHPLIDYDQL